MMTYKNKIQVLLMVIFLCMSGRLCLLAEENNFIHSNGLSGEICDAQALFESTYNELYKNGNLRSFYEQNTTSGLMLTESEQKNNFNVLCFIDWLSKESNQENVFLLACINKLYYLEFLQRIALLDSKKEHVQKILNQLHELYNYTIIDDKNSELSPFRTSLSKLLIFIYMVNASGLSFEDRRSTLILSLDKIKQEMLVINKQYFDNKIDNNLIRSFVTMLEAYMVKEPYIRAALIKNILFYAVITGTLSFVIYKLFLNRDQIIPRVEKFGNDLKDFIMKPIGKGLASGIFEEAENDPNIKKKLEQMDRTLAAFERAVGLLNDERITNIVTAIQQVGGAVSRLNDERITNIVTAIQKTGNAADRLSDERIAALTLAIEKIGNAANDPTGVRGIGSSIKNLFIKKQ